MVMIFMLSFADLLQSEKNFITDCYSPKTNMVLVSINGQQSFQLILDPTLKKECAQLPRGLNITVYATALVDGSSNFVPNSVIVFDFSYSSTVGIVIPCTQCTDDSYLSSDQIIVTMESAVHFTRIVMGAVQTESGQQVDCFLNPAVIMDKDLILIRTQQTGNCPQLISPLQPANLKNVVLADFYIIYENGDIDRFEKIQIGTQVLLSPSPAVASAETNFTIQIANIGVKATQQWVMFVQMQLYFESATLPIQASFQSSYLISYKFPGGFNSIKAKIQSTSIHLDIQANETIVTEPGFTGKLADFYNQQITNDLAPDNTVIQIIGFSTNIPTEYLIHSPFQTTSAAQLPREKMMTLTVDVDSFGYKTGLVSISCDMTANEKQCEADLARLLTIKNPNFIVLFQMLYYKNNQQIAAISQYISQIQDSCFSSATAQIIKENIEITIEENVGNSHCSLIKNKNYTAVLNFTGFNLTTIQSDVYIWTFSNTNFSGNISIPLTTDQLSILHSVSEQRDDETYKLYTMLKFVSQNTIIDQVAISAISTNDIQLFKQDVTNCIIGIAIASVVICASMLVFPNVIKRVKPKLEQKKLIKQKIATVQDDL
ncbi:Conserved_hypothetical protein [Hexamita inflata]|uniref:Transmembrane protein n=1 Tax=Hexamita inflata TaxID=28002 RepID=A0ABP1GKL6_9EUKA